MYGTIKYTGPENNSITKLDSCSNLGIVRTVLATTVSIGISLAVSTADESRRFSLPYAMSRPGLKKVFAYFRLVHGNQVLVQLPYDMVFGRSIKFFA